MKTHPPTDRNIMSKENVQTATEVEGPSFFARIPKKKAAIAATAVTVTVVAGVLVSKYGIPVPARFVKNVTEDLSTTA
jgi:hypothetical protein